MTDHFPERPTSLAAAARTHWRGFAGMWLFPFYVTLVLPHIVPSGSGFWIPFVFLVIPVSAALIPLQVMWMRHQVRFRHLALLGVVLPFVLIWIVWLLPLLAPGP